MRARVSSLSQDAVGQTGTDSNLWYIHYAAAPVHRLRGVHPPLLSMHAYGGHGAQCLPAGSYLLEDLLWYANWLLAADGWLRAAAWQLEAGRMLLVPGWKPKTTTLTNTSLN